MAERAYFISDVHLGSLAEPNAFKLLQFLNGFQSRDQISHLFLVGDIFDLWVAAHEYFVHKYAALLDELNRLKKMGVEVHYFEGNHDLYLQHYFGDILGFHIHTGPGIFDLCGKKVRVEHGDEMDPTDVGYRFLRWFLRTPFMKRLAPRLPSLFVVYLGHRMSRASRSYTSGRKSLSEEKARRIIRAHAARAWVQQPFDLLVCGHIHVTEDATFRPESRVINLGSWLTETPTVLQLDKKGIRLLPLEENPF